MKTAVKKFIVFPWNKNLETGIFEIDEQHKKLVEILNKLAGTLIEEDHLEIDNAFDELAEYAEYHFQTEERIWRKYFGQDSWLESHQMSHAGFLPKLIDMKEGEINHSLRNAMEKVVKFLIRWLAFHIIDNDRRMAIVIENMEMGKTLPEAKVAADERMSGSIRVLIETILTMYDGLSTRTLDLMRERSQRERIEKQLLEANRKLEIMAITDILTNLHNRRHFQKVFTHELRRAKRENLPLALLLFDIDYFKKYNDNYGHSKGDHALSAIGACIKGVCRRPGDFSFRFGGEEFCIILSNPKNRLEVKEFSEQLLKAIANLNIPHAFSDVMPMLTGSLGGIYVPQVSQTEEEIIKQADDNLYEAKRLGRNRCIITEWIEATDASITEKEFLGFIT